MRHLFFPAFALVLGSLAAGCDRPANVAEGAEAVAHQPVYIDSIFPIEEEVRRFRATLDEAPDRLSGGADSRDALVAQFVAALEAGNGEAMRSLSLTRAEFAYLYYPFTKYTHRPYELSPTIVWFQLENYSGKGFNRAMSRYGGRPLDVTGYRCDDPPTAEERNTLWARCVVERIGEHGEPEALPILGPILERDGQFKFLSFANAL